jgi:hypothetical protein
LDHHLDTELVDEESDWYSSSDGNVQEDRGRYSHRLLTYHREAFYEAYMPEWQKGSKSSHLINQDKYDEIVRLLQTERQPKEPPCCQSIGQSMLCVAMWLVAACIAYAMAAIKQFPLWKQCLTLFWRRIPKEGMQKVPI